MTEQPTPYPRPPANGTTGTAGVPDVTPTVRTDAGPEELRAELGELRSELGDTVEELAHRVDVPARVRAGRDEAVAKVKDAGNEAVTQARTQLVRAQSVVQERAPGLAAVLRERPLAASGAVLAAVLLAVRAARRSHGGRASAGRRP